MRIKKLMKTFVIIRVQLLLLLNFITLSETLNGNLENERLIQNTSINYENLLLHF